MKVNIQSAKGHICIYSVWMTSYYNEYVLDVNV